MAYQPSSDLATILRTLLPSWIGLIWTTIGAFILIGGHILFLSLGAGTAFTNILDGDLSIVYTNYIVAPLLHVLNFESFGVAVNIIIWGLLGWLLLSLGELAANNYYEWRQAEDDIQIVSGKVIEHPLRRTYMTRILWRYACIVGFVLLLLAAPRLLRIISGIDQQLFRGQAWQQALPYFIKAVILWVFLEYCSIILLRFYTFRTRLTSNPLKR